MNKTIQPRCGKCGREIFDSPPIHRNGVPIHPKAMARGYCIIEL